MKINVTVILFVLFAAVLGYAYFLSVDNKRLKEEEEIAYNNLRAELSDSDTLKSQSKLYKMTIEELENRNDSTSIALLKLKKELKIKDKNLKALAEIQSSFSSSDTLVIRDTIFKYGVKLDTTIGNEWYKANILLKYPDTIKLNLSTVSKKEIVVHSRKFIRNPSKCFFIRWFQKKHTEVVIDVKDQNPYIKEDDSRFIEIIE